MYHANKVLITKFKRICCKLLGMHNGEFMYPANGFEKTQKQKFYFYFTECSDYPKVVKFIRLTDKCELNTVFAYTLSLVK